MNKENQSETSASPKSMEEKTIVDDRGNFLKRYVEINPFRKESRRAVKDGYRESMLQASPINPFKKMEWENNEG